MDARQALGPRMGPAARSSREQGRSEGTRSEAQGRMNGAPRLWLLWPRPIYGHPIFCNTVHQMEWMACFNLSGVYWARIPRHDEHSHLAILTK